MELYLIRHGETDWNAQQRFQGREDIPLNERGRRQVEASGHALRNKDIRAVYSSPLSRARHTAEAVAVHHGCTVLTDERLVERNLGRLSGLLPPEREAFTATGQPTEMEPGEEVVARLLAALAHIADSVGESGCAAVVAHGACINLLLSHILGHKADRLLNAGISLLRRKESGWEVVFYNKSAQELEEMEKGAL